MLAVGAVVSTACCAASSVTLAVSFSFADRLLLASGRHVHAAFAWKGFFLCAQLPCAAGSGLKLPGRGGILPVLSGVCPWPLSCGSVLAVSAVVSTACCAAWSVMLATSSPFAVGLLLLPLVFMCMLHLHGKGFFVCPAALCCRFRSEAAWQRRHPPCLWCVPGPCPAVRYLQSVQ
ncbi:hypothetical protein COO60DRAFT_286804 [Scenedesmus sp. NREL 46B-D3]|nr:hypothetical protein COO60DRAFT_286804 [Scenedesmus sp. NREL 46B-D3]